MALKALHLGFVRLIERRDTLARDMQHTAQEVAALEAAGPGARCACGVAAALPVAASLSALLLLAH